MQHEKPRRVAARIMAGTFANVIRQYQASSNYKDLAPATRRNYDSVLRIAEDAIGGFSVQQIRPAIIQSFLDGLAETPGKQMIARTAIKAMEKYALVRDLLVYPISTGTEVVGCDGGHEPWTDEHVRVAEAHARPDLARVVTLAVNTGQRGSDVVRMCASDIEVHHGHPGINVIQRKTGVRLWVPFTPELIEAMASWEKRPGPFVLKPNGKPYSRELLSWHWNHERDNNPALAELKAAGLVLHGLRATAIVRLRKAGASVMNICDMVGLSEPMVARYSRLADKTERALAAVHFLDRTGGEQTFPTLQKVGK
ncbi:MAG: tyrosine-type recombinase/integrase [Patescibacteria group bacterium]|nr:tyrosine-type recombinase/integrase [Patescibacteria group bacterium]